METTGKCPHCNETINLSPYINSDLQLLCDDLHHALKIMHHYCDPYDMFPEDIDLWRKWDRKFNPENYDKTSNKV